jgi:hypothetical protein
MMKKLLILALFALPCIAQAPDFQVILIPDSQYESQLNYQLQHMSTWITTQSTYTNVQMVVAEGDLVDSDVSAQWTNYLNGMFNPLMTANIPYVATVGNHDYCGDGAASGQPCGTSNQDTSLRIDADFISNIESVTATKSYFGSAWSTDAANHWVHFTVSGHNYGVIALEFCPRPAAVTWAAGVMAANPTTEFMIDTHAWIQPSTGLMGTVSTSGCSSSGNDGTGQADSVSNSPATAWTTLKASTNLFLVVNGHYYSSPTANYAATGTNGNTVAMIDTDYQFVSSGNNVMRILNISETNHLISAYTYTPYDWGSHVPVSYTDAANQFTMGYNPQAFGDGSSSNAGMSGAARMSGNAGIQ